MKISVNWVKQFTNVDISIDELVSKIGAQLGAVDEVVDLGMKYYGIVIAKVVECIKHPDADKLHVCKIDDGGVVDSVERDSAGLVQVVCGAPNVRAGLTVAWLPPGITVPVTADKDPFVLEARKIRGITSNGMLASAHELAISDDHNGIVEIEIDAKPGAPFAEVYQLNDYVIDVENKMFTHRPDCFGILGVAREIAGIQGIRFKSPDWYLEATGDLKTAKTTLDVVVDNKLPDLVPRFLMLAMSGVKVKPSPLIMQSYLSRVGIKPINNIVDITNYLMYLTGQPLHAFDYDKVHAINKKHPVKIEVRHPLPKEKIALLNGKTIEPKTDAIMIATPDALIGVAGIMGGTLTEIDETTTNILIECATFDMYSIRRTSMAHGLFTDAVTRFNKGQSPRQNTAVMMETVNLMRSLTGGEVDSILIDIQGNVAAAEPVEITTSFINERLGLNLQTDDVVTILENVECMVRQTDDSLIIEPPFWRTDIHQPEDVVEEVGRLIGFDKLPLELPKRDLKPAKTEPLLKLKQQLRNTLSAAGANEILTYSFVHGDFLSRIGQDVSIAYQLSNAISPDLQYYRVSLLPSVLEKVHQNIKAGYSRFALFEIGKAHLKYWMDDENLPKEEQRLAFVFAAESTSAKAYQGAAFYQAKAYLNSISHNFQFEVIEELPELSKDQQMLAPFDHARTAIIRDNAGRMIGVIGEFKASVRKNLKLPAFSAGFELDLKQLLEMDSEQKYQVISRYPSVEQDICLRLDSNVSYGTLHAFVVATINEAKPDDTQTSITPVDIYKKDEDDTKRQITLRLRIAHHSRTLTAGEVNTLLDSVAEAAGRAFGAVRV